MDRSVARQCNPRIRGGSHPGFRRIAVDVDFVHREPSQTNASTAVCLSGELEPDGRLDGTPVDALRDFLQALSYESGV